MTDGQTGHKTALDSLNALKNKCNAQNIDFRFFCLGFSSGHDAALLSQIARSGSDLGNFVYIADDSKDKYEDMKRALIEIFDLVPGKDSHKATLRAGDFSSEVRVSKDAQGEMFKAQLTFPFSILSSPLVLTING
jgi:hypothetical protein